MAGAGRRSAALVHPRRRAHHRRPRRDRGSGERAAAELALSATGEARGSVEQDWDELPLVQVHAASLDSALAFIDHDEVVATHEIVQYRATDAQSFPLVDQPAAIAAG